MENAKKNLVFHFGVGRHASFPQKPVVKSRFASTDKIKGDISKIMRDETEGIPTEGWQSLVHTDRTKNSYLRNSGNTLAKISWMLWSYFACLPWKLLKPMRLI